MSDPSTRLPGLVRNASSHPAYDRLKRLFDGVLALLLLALMGPLLLGVAALIVGDSGLPIFFRQTRIGRGGRPFDLIKFRTLRPGPHDPHTPGRHATRVGRVLRRWAVDELPQLWNVWRGEMSLVGPRPTLPDQVAHYGPFERRRLDVRPGLTGWAQIHGRNALPWPERIRLDVWYVEHRSFRLDLHILLRTPGVLLRGRGVYGAAGRNPGFSADGSSVPPESHDAAAADHPVWMP